MSVTFGDNLTESFQVFEQRELHPTVTMKVCVLGGGGWGAVGVSGWELEDHVGGGRGAEKGHTTHKV